MITYLFGLAEYIGEYRENCSSLIDNFCEAELGIKEVGQHIERAHLLGKRNMQSENPRPIVVKFSTYRMREKRTVPDKSTGKEETIPIIKETRRNRKTATLV